jgi:hypothetical protein
VSVRSSSASLVAAFVVWCAAGCGGPFECTIRGVNETFESCEQLREEIAAREQASSDEVEDLEQCVRDRCGAAE